METSKLKRIGVSIEETLLAKFDGLVDRRGYENRSEAVRDIIRETLLEHSWEKDEQIVAGSIMLFYNHHRRHLMDELTNIQHEMHDYVMATTHFHMDHYNCLEIVVVKGKANEIQGLKDKLTSLKGVTYGGFNIAPVEHI